MKSVESFCKKAIEMGIEEAKIIDPGSIVTAEWVRMKCQYGCSGFIADRHNSHSEPLPIL